MRLGFGHLGLGYAKNLSEDSGVTWTGTFTPTDDITATSNTILVGTGYEDLAGNTGTAGTSVSYDIDTLAPTLTSVSISTNYTITTEARIGNIITLIFTASETITPTVVIKDYQSNVLSTDSLTNDGDDWTVTHTTVLKPIINPN